jgi:hypothetical protein
MLWSWAGKTADSSCARCGREPPADWKSLQLAGVEAAGQRGEPRQLAQQTEVADGDHCCIEPNHVAA